MNAADQPSGAAKAPFSLNGHCPLGHSFTTWRRIQHQEPVIRWAKWREAYPELRIQHLRDHVPSLTALVSESLIDMRRWYTQENRLDEALVLRLATQHDLGEGLLGIDVMATKKKAVDDLKEYRAYEELYRPRGGDVWPELQRAFLLQTCLHNDECFPADARAVMTELAVTHHREARFFRGIEMLDYLYYAYEGAAEQGVMPILCGVAANHLQAMDDIAEKVPGFGQAVWISPIRAFFTEAAANHKEDMLAAGGHQPWLFEME